MNLESTYKTKLMAECRDLGAYARRLEDKWAVGRLDLMIKFPRFPVLLVEAKIVAHQQFEPTLRQYEEGKRFIDAGGICCLIAWDKATKAMFIHHWAKVAHKANSFPRGGSGSSFKEQAQALWDWLDLREEQEEKWRRQDSPK